MPPLPTSQDAITHDLMTLAEYADSLDALPIELTRGFGDLRELDAVLSSSLIHLTSRIQSLTASLLDPSLSASDRLFLLKSVADNAAQFKLGGEDKIRVVGGVCEGVASHQHTLTGLLTASTLLTPIPIPVGSFQTQRQSFKSGLTPNRRGRRAAASKPYQIGIGAMDDFSIPGSPQPHHAAVMERKKPGPPKGSKKRRLLAQEDDLDGLDGDDDDINYTGAVGTSSRPQAATSRRVRALVTTQHDEVSLSGGSALGGGEDDNATFNGSPPRHHHHLDTLAAGMDGHAGDDEMIDVGVDEGDGDGDGATYCICGGGSFGEMIGCDDENCEVEWYHLACLSLDRTPEGDWVCDLCLKRRALEEKEDSRDAFKGKKAAAGAAAAAAAAARGARANSRR